MASLLGACQRRVPEPGESWQAAGPPAVPPPHELEPAGLSRLFGDDRPFELRPADPSKDGAPFAHPFWVRVTEPVADDPALHAGLLTFLSDIAVVNAARAPLSRTRYGLLVSLDHSIWFHRPPRVDQWLLYDMGSVAHVGSRGLATGSMRTTDGTLIASIVQEVLLRR
ncbi:MULTISPECIES: acyl-CoA thioesterase domain-containing protein [Actinomadura]|uniref:Acyl-CoA thioesterase domain-containing protein n=1 Tax=Actinomadura yumaensis TaxID=111807 RepID=A0ABW2CPV1_9ACTN